MHPCPGNWVTMAIECAVVYHARAAHAFSAGIKCLYCTWQQVSCEIYTEDPRHALNMDCLNVIVIKHLSNWCLHNRALEDVRYIGAEMICLYCIRQQVSCMVYLYGRSPARPQHGLPGCDCYCIFVHPAWIYCTSAPGWFWWCRCHLACRARLLISQARNAICRENCRLQEPYFPAIIQAWSICGSQLPRTKLFVCLTGYTVQAMNISTDTMLCQK